MFNVFLTASTGFGFQRSNGWRDAAARPTTVHSTLKAIEAGPFPSAESNRARWLKKLCASINCMVLIWKVMWFGSDSQDVFPICRICLDNCRDGGMGGESLCIRRDSKRLMGTFLEIPSRSSHSTNVHIITIIVLRVYFRIVQHMDVFTPLYDLLF